MPVRQTISDNAGALLAGWFYNSFFADDRAEQDTTEALTDRDFEPAIEDNSQT